MREQYFLLGHPVSHSKSPAMHNALYRELGLPWRYGAKDCGTAEEAEGFLAGGGFAGINITTPYKPLAFEAATVKAASAKLAKGANVLVRKGEALIAYNLDGEGCVRALRRTGFSFDGALVVVCGSGPTALAILHAAVLEKAGKAVLVGRDKDRTRKALEGYVEEFGKLAYATIDLPPAREGQRSFRKAYEDAAFSYGSYATATGIFREADLVVNATPLGMREGDGAPFDTGLLTAGQTVLDVVYGHGETALVRGARQQGCRVHDGSGMLVAQAVATARVFLDVAQKDVSMDDDGMFSIMARAAGFE